MKQRFTLDDNLKTEQELKDYEQTVKEIIRLSNLYWKDLLEPNKHNFDFKKASFPEYFFFIRSLPYVSDPKKIEHVSRPKISLEKSGLNYPFDCDDRSVLTRSFVKLKNFLISGNPDFPIISKVVCAGRSFRPHHVYVSIKIGSVEIPVDPTYPKNEYAIKLFPEGFRKEFF